VNLLGGAYQYCTLYQHVRRDRFPARRQKSTSQSIEPPAIDGKALQCESFLTLYSDQSKAQCLTTSGTTLSSFNYTYNPVGNRTQVVEADGDVLTLSYDPTYQLTNERRGGANSSNISYTYDPVANRTVLTNSGASGAPT
jgi:YD repeat-containing protein